MNSIYENAKYIEEHHSQAELFYRLAPRARPLFEGEARACERALGKVCTCRCGGILHGIYSIRTVLR